MLKVDLRAGVMHVHSKMSSTKVEPTYLTRSQPQTKYQVSYPAYHTIGAAQAPYTCHSSHLNNPLQLHLLLIANTMVHTRTMLATFQLFVLLSVCNGKLRRCEAPFLPPWKILVPGLLRGQQILINHLLSVCMGDKTLKDTDTHVASVQLQALAPQTPGRTASHRPSVLPRTPSAGPCPAKQTHAWQQTRADPTPSLLRGMVRSRPTSAGGGCCQVRPQAPAGDSVLSAHAQGIAECRISMPLGHTLPQHHVAIPQFMQHPAYKHETTSSLPTNAHWDDCTPAAEVVYWHLLEHASFHISPLRSTV
jgi:hypothetical protein